MDFHTSVRSFNNDGRLETTDLQLGDATAWMAQLQGSSAKFVDSDGTINVDALVSKGGEQVILDPPAGDSVILEVPAWDKTANAGQSYQRCSDAKYCFAAETPDAENTCTC